MRCGRNLSNHYSEWWGSQVREMPVDHQGLVRAVDSKKRLKWDRQLQERFVDAVTRLGGADKATPKSVMQVMKVPGLTLYHLKSHLQKYRFAKNRNAGIGNEYKKQSRMVAELRAEDDQSQPQLNEAVLQRIQEDVQRKLHQVQNRLQLRIEAQGKYLQSMLRKAEKTLAECISCSLGTEATRAELPELFSSVQTDSSFAHGGFIFQRTLQNSDFSLDSCFTSEKSDSREAVKERRQTWIRL